MPTYDKRVPGMSQTLYEPGIDFRKLRCEKLTKVQREMARREIGAMLLTDIINIRYTTGVAVMPLWTAVNLAHYVLVPVEGSPVIHEYSRSMFRAEMFWEDVRPAFYWQSRFADQLAGSQADKLAGMVGDMMAEWGVADSRLAIDVLDHHGYAALQRAGLHLTDADAPLEAARSIKTPEEIDLMRLSATVCEAALYDLERSIRPGISENEMLGVFWNRMLALGGEYCFTRLLVSGYKTNPWFHEAGSKLVRPGDLVGIDTDMIGPEGYACDISRTFLCGTKPTAAQKEAYRVAYDHVQGLIELCQVGASYADVSKNAPKLPPAYQAQRYPSLIHGIGTDDEPPFIPHSDQDLRVMPEGEFRENMVVSVECYAGKEGEQDGVKLEDEVWITRDGPVVLSLYPYDEKLLAR